MKTIRIVVALSTITTSSMAFAVDQPPTRPGFITRVLQRVTGKRATPTPIVEREAAAPASEPAPLALQIAPTTEGKPGEPATAIKAETPIQPVTPIKLEASRPAAAPAVAPSVIVHRPSEAPAPSSPSLFPRSDGNKSYYPGLSELRLRGDSWASKSFRSEPVKVGYEKLPAEQRAPIERLLAQTERPTLKQLKQAMRTTYGDSMPTENPFGSAGHVKNEATLIADMVAQLEHAFPGGHYLPLGRDAVLIADALEGFYTAIGQKGRVKRLDMSGLSLPNYRSANARTYEEDRPIITDFLRTNGLDLENASKKAPYIMIDVTSYGETSQSTQLVRSVYRTWVKDMGGDPKALYDRVNFVGTPMGGRVTFISDHKNIDAVKDRLRSQTGTDGPRELLYLGGNMSRLTYTPSWHSDFVKMQRQPNGTVTAEPGRQNSLDSKQEVLAELFEVDALTSKPEFLDKVRRIAIEKYGFEFPMQQTEHIKRLASSASAASVVHASSKEPITIAATASKEDSGFMKSLRLRLPTAQNKQEVAADFLGDLAGMWARKSFSARETRDAIREINKHINLRSPAMRDSVFEVVGNYPDFRRVIEKALRKRT